MRAVESKEKVSVVGVGSVAVGANSIKEYRMGTTVIDAFSFVVTLNLIYILS